MKTLDISTLFAVTVFVAVLAGLMLLFAWLRDRQGPALAWWSVGFLVSAPAFALIGLRGTVNDLWSIDVANTGLFGVLALAWGTVRRFEGRPLAPALLILPLLPWVAAAVFVPHFSAAADFRVILAAAIMIAYPVLIARELWIGNGERLRSRPPTIALMLGHAAWFLMRGVLCASGLVPGAALAQGHLWLALAAFEGILFALVGAFLALSLVKERQEWCDRAAARIDPLTGAGNRRAFGEAIATIAARPDAATTPVALLLFDLDQFKAINDTWGHPFGDRVLRLFAESARGELRRSDLFSRLGGEEFAAVVVGAGREEALGIAERVRLGFAAAAGVIEGRRVDATVSVGLASRPGLPAGFDQMFDEADRALYLAKATGRNRVRQAREPEAPPAALSAA